MCTFGDSLAQNDLSPDCCGSSDERPPMSHFSLKPLVVLAVTFCLSAAAHAECSIPTEENDWGATCHQATSPFNQSDFAASCFYGDDETQCHSDGDQAACDRLDECIRNAAISTFGDG